MENGERAEFAKLAHALGHEMLTPLSGLTMLLASMRSGECSDPSRDEKLQQARQATERLTRLVRAFVDYVDAAVCRPPQRVDTRTLVDEVLVAGGAGVVVEGDLPTVCGDRGGLRRVLASLLDNAKRYAEGTAPLIEVAARRDGHAWRFEVRDRGSGIDEALRARLFTPLVRGRGHDQVSGSGLSLATCARIVACHGGRIGLDPRPGGGTIAWFTVPDAGPTNG
ncbi:MAG: HAMP domain-containing sensor histidine kinase [Planctomycetota bacterium]